MFWFITHFVFMFYMPPIFDETILPQIIGDSCPEVYVNEWQERSVYSKEEQKKALDSLNESCKLLNNEISLFLKNKGLIFTKLKTPKIQVSLLNPGRCWRCLNSEFRFVSRYKEFKNNKVIPIFGYYHYKDKRLYLANGLLVNDKYNQFTMMVFAHELFHAYIHQNNLLKQIPSRNAEELWAREFTDKIGLGQ